MHWRTSNVDWQLLKAAVDCDVTQLADRQTAPCATTVGMRDSAHRLANYVMLSLPTRGQNVTSGVGEGGVPGV